MDRDPPGAQVSSSSGTVWQAGTSLQALAGVNAAVVVRAGGEHFFPRLAVGGGESLVERKALSSAGVRPATRNCVSSLEQGIAQAIEALEMPEEQEQALQVAAGEFLIQPVERVGHGVREVLLRQVFL